VSKDFTSYPFGLPSRSFSDDEQAVAFELEPFRLLEQSDLRVYKIRSSRIALEFSLRILQTPHQNITHEDIVPRLEQMLFDQPVANAEDRGSASESIN